jgi:hypothetical protein
MVDNGKEHNVSSLFDIIKSDEIFVYLFTFTTLQEKLTLCVVCKFVLSLNRKFSTKNNTNTHTHSLSFYSLTHSLTLTYSLDMLLDASIKF